MAETLLGEGIGAGMDLRDASCLVGKRRVLATLSSAMHFIREALRAALAASRGELTGFSWSTATDDADFSTLVVCS